MMLDKYVICSECFHRHGIKMMAVRYGVKDGRPCPLCGSSNGAKLTQEQAKELAGDYIVNGSYHRTTFGGASIYMVSDVGHDDKLFNDDPNLLFLQEKCGLTTFLYAPATWRVGITTWLEDLLSKNGNPKAKVVKKLIDECDKKECVEGTLFYRLLPRLFGDSKDPLTYDSPHWRYQKNGRFRLCKKSVLYLSSSIESAIHECRVTVEDDPY